MVVLFCGIKWWDKSIEIRDGHDYTLRILPV